MTVDPAEWGSSTEEVHKLVLRTAGVTHAADPLARLGTSALSDRHMRLGFGAGHGAAAARTNDCAGYSAPRLPRQFGTRQQ